MVTKYVPQDYAETRDSISWAWAYAPDFKGQRTLDEMFEDLFYGVNAEKAKTTSPEKLVILEECLQKLASSKAAFLTQDGKAANQALFDAGQLFRSLRRRRK